MNTMVIISLQKRYQQTTVHKTSWHMEKLRIYKYSNCEVIHTGWTALYSLANRWHGPDKMFVYRRVKANLQWVHYAKHSNFLLAQAQLQSFSKVHIYHISVQYYNRYNHAEIICYNLKNKVSSTRIRTSHVLDF